MKFQNKNVTLTTLILSGVLSGVFLERVEAVKEKATSLSRSGSSDEAGSAIRPSAKDEMKSRMDLKSGDSVSKSSKSSEHIQTQPPARAEDLINANLIDLTHDGVTQISKTSASTSASSLSGDAGEFKVRVMDENLNREQDGIESTAKVVTPGMTRWEKGIDSNGSMTVAISTEPITSWVKSVKYGQILLNREGNAMFFSPKRGIQWLTDHPDFTPQQVIFTVNVDSPLNYFMSEQRISSFENGGKNNYMLDRGDVFLYDELSYMIDKYEGESDAIAIEFPYLEDFNKYRDDLSKER